MTGPRPDDGGWEPRGRPVRWAVGLLVGAMALCSAAAVTGWVAPDVTATPAAWTSSADSKVVVLDLVVASHRTSPLRIDAVGESLPGLRLLSVGLHDPRHPRPVPFEPTTVDKGGTGLELQLVYVVDDCDALPRDHVGMVVRAHTAIGREVELHPRLVVSDVTGAPAMRTYSGDDPFDEPWQLSVTRSACPA